MKSQYFVSLVAALLALLMITPAAAEPLKTRATLYYLMNNWKTEVPDVDQYDLNEGAFGLDAFVAPGDRFSLALNGRLSSSKYEVDGSAEEGKLSSLNDTRLVATYYTASGVASLSGIVNLPTGKTKLDDEEFSVAMAVADNTRKYVTRRYGQGLDLGVEGLVHPQSGNLTFHFGGGFMHKGKYQLREADTEKYKYGDEITGRAGLNVDADAIHFLVDGTYAFYLEDKFGDQKVYKAGPTIIVRSQVSYTQDHTAYAGIMLVNRSKAEVRNDAGEENLTEEASKSGRNEFLLYLGGGYLATEKLRVNGRLEFQNFSSNDYAENSVLYRPKSNYLGISGGASYALTEMLYGSGLLTLYTGSVDLGENDADLSGLGLLFALTYRVM